MQRVFEFFVTGGKHMVLIGFVGWLTKRADACMPYFGSPPFGESYRDY